MSQYGKNKKVAHKMQLNLFSCQIVKQGKIANSAIIAEEWKRDWDYNTVYYSAMFY